MFDWRFGRKKFAQIPNNFFQYCTLFRYLYIAIFVYIILYQQWRHTYPTHTFHTVHWALSDVRLPGNKPREFRSNLRFFADDRDNLSRPIFIALVSSAHRRFVRGKHGRVISICTVDFGYKGLSLIRDDFSGPFVKNVRNFSYKGHSDIRDKLNGPLYPKSTVCLWSRRD